VVLLNFDLFNLVRRVLCGLYSTDKLFCFFSVEIIGEVKTLGVLASSILVSDLVLDLVLVQHQVLDYEHAVVAEAHLSRVLKHHRELVLNLFVPLLPFLLDQWVQVQVRDLIRIVFFRSEFLWLKLNL